MIKAQVEVVDESGHTDKTTSQDSAHVDGEQTDPVESSLVRRAQASAARGATAVSQQLQRLRDQGKIDDNDRLLVPIPDDMKPGSQTDL
jgi:hypothetical protein